VSRETADRFVLSVDLGTGGPKVGLVSVRGQLVYAEHQVTETTLLPGGGAVQDPEHWWTLVTQAAKRALTSGAIDPDHVVAVSCTGQWASTVPVDEQGHPVGPCLLWLDGRGGRHTRATIGGPLAGYAPRALATWIRHAGGVPSTSGADPVGHMLFLENEEPAIAAKARWYLEPVDYLAMRFCGRAAASFASMTGAWLTDNRYPDRLVYDKDLVARAGVPADKLAPLVGFGDVVGTVTAAVARHLGLAHDVVVIAGTPDLHSAVVGSGAVGPAQSHLTLSTTSWISCPVGFKKTDVRRQITSVPGLEPGSYLVVNNHETAGRALEWWRDSFASPDESQLRPSYEELTALAADQPPGSGGVMFTPWLAGERSPVDDRRARGGFHNLSLSSSRAAMTRAVLEGVAYNSKWLFDAVEHFAGSRLDHVRLVGGGASSELWCRIHADVLGRSVVQVADPLHANLRGAGLLAGLALKEIRLDDVASFVPISATFAPNGDTRELYEEQYAEFPKLYTAQKKMFRRLN
jgi:xylulokinase